MLQIAVHNYPEISVVMSCHNASRWLHEAIDSVLAQTFENFELILVDDGSLDDTWAIIQGYQAQDKRIIAINKANTGLADSLNIGIAQAKGAWIARLDADDLCEATRLEEQFSFVHTHPEVVLLGTGFWEIDEHGQDIKKQVYPSEHHKLIRHLERSQRFFPHSSAFFRRIVVQEMGGYNPLFRKAQDRDLWLRFAARGEIACLESCLVKVRMHSGQISNSASGFSQLVYGVASSTCHFLKIHGSPDLSNFNDDASWQNFISWVDSRMTEEGVFERRNAWLAARSDFFATKTRLVGFLRFSTSLLQSGYAGALLWDKIFGSTLPQRLALEWMKRSFIVP